MSSVFVVIGLFVVLCIVVVLAGGKTRGEPKSGCSSCEHKEHCPTCDHPADPEDKTCQGCGCSLPKNPE